MKKLQEKNKIEKKKKQAKGITLIALVITIIVLLILAGVSIAMLTGQNGILTQAQNAKEETQNAQRIENEVLNNYEQYIEGSINGGNLMSVTGYETTNTTVQDSLGNVITVPVGFRIVNPGDNVEDGIIIEDVKHESTKGSQFVWIPVGEINTSKGKIIINLNRYTFDTSTGKATPQGNSMIRQKYQELNNGKGNITAKEDIESEEKGFKKSVKENKGYYIGRYEARTAIQRNSPTSDNELTQLTEKQRDYIYNYVTQAQAATLSRNMYDSDFFMSDLTNSYAWDTAIFFLQEFDNRVNKSKPYSIQNSLNTESIAMKGTTNDIICNIYDMASNCSELTTETSEWENQPCVRRGGYYNNNSRYTSIRFGGSISFCDDVAASFRPILYLK